MTTQPAPHPTAPHPTAPHPTETLSAKELLADLDHLYRTRLDTLRHGSDQAVAASAERIGELEAEYLRRRPDREVDPRRLRPEDPPGDDRR